MTAPELTIARITAVLDQLDDAFNYGADDACDELGIDEVTFDALHTLRCTDPIGD